MLHQISAIANVSLVFYHLCCKVKIPLYGCDCYAYALLASGFVDLVVQSCLKV
jgi:inositol-phosphate phosphatase / L-galactose 1-phosphate phosphatase / histidinol-phosphatase